MAEIKVMPKQLAELIAAGEVVERPASVVKELLENSIDAGADTVTLEIRNGGISYIRITDNGKGMSREDVPTAFISHATSKISSATDLDSILTLGFRGEALPSIASVSKVEVLTRTKNEETGTRYCAEYGEEILIDEAGCPYGTTITVRDIFQKTPARMKFLKKDVTEANAVASVIDRTALSHPEISFRFIRDGKQTLFTSGDGNLLNTVRGVFGKEFASQLIPCENNQGDVKVSGFISRPEFSRPNRNMQYFFINGRYVRTGTGSAALSEGYRNSIMVGKFPSCIINIEINPSLVDVNVHPAKTEVRFGDEKPVFNSVYGAVRNALAAGDTPHQIQTKQKPYTFPVSYTESAPQKPEQVKLTDTKNNLWQKEFVSESKNTDSQPVKYTPPVSEPIRYTPPVTTTVVARTPEKELKKDDPSIDNIDDILLRSPSESLPAERRENAVIEPVKPGDINDFDEEKFRLVGEAFMTYIICEYKSKLIIIDKHAAHERIIYERLKKESGERTGQLLLMPVTVNLPKEEYSAIIENLEIISRAGFEIEDFGNGTVIVRMCPMELTFDDVPDIISEIAGRFVEKRRDVMFEKLDWLYHSVACRSAIKAGNFTSKYEMEKFAKQLLSMPDIRYCPHGRPVLIEMTQRELEKNFGRI